MPRNIKDIFNDHPNLERIEISGFNDGNPFGMSGDGLVLKILDANLVKEFVHLPGVNLESGHINDEGFFIRGGYTVLEDSYKFTVHRSVPK